MDNINITKKCMGCMACIEACPHKCINKKEDERGFTSAFVGNEKECTHCGICVSVCPVHNNVMQENQYVMGGRVKEEKILYKSTSGGLFYTLAKQFLKDEGVVCGAIFDDWFVVKHVVVDSIDNSFLLKKMQGAKYVQSDTSGLFVKILQYLRENRKVLFSGTPCQVSAVKNFVNKFAVDKSNYLFCIDIMCHGVPSPGLFKEYVLLLEQKYGKINNIYFRDKRIGWRGQNASIDIDNFDSKTDSFINSYEKLYFSSLITRESCHECSYAKLTRAGDITIGDLWGVEKINPLFDDNKGCSLIMVNSNKGEKLVNGIQDHMSLFPIYSDEYVQPNMLYPTKESAYKEMFWRWYKKLGYEKSYKKIYIYFKYKNRIRNIKQCIKKLLKNDGYNK